MRCFNVTVAFISYSFYFLYIPMMSFPWAMLTEFLKDKQHVQYPLVEIGTQAVPLNFNYQTEFSNA